MLQEGKDVVQAIVVQFAYLAHSIETHNLSKFRALNLFLQLTHQSITLHHGGTL